MTPLKISQLPQFSGDSSGSYILINDASNSVTYIVKKEDFLSGSFYGTASYAYNSDSSSYSFEAISASYSFTASYIELAQTSSFVTSSNVYGPYGSDSVLSSSYALTASYALNGGGGSGEPAFPFSGSAVITGSLLVRESFVDFSSASYFVGNLTGSLFGTSSWARNALTASYNYPISVSGSSLYSVYPVAGPNVNTQNSVIFGNAAGRQSFFADVSNFIGNQAGFLAYTASYSNFFGFNAGFNAEKANSSNFIGRQSGQSARLAEKSNFLGFLAGVSAVSASYSTLIGFNVGAEYVNFGSSVGRNNIIIGTSVTLPYNYQNGINLGGLIFGSGSYFNSSEATNPFSGSANGRIGINQPNPLFSLDVSGSGRYTNGLQITGSVSVTGSLSVDGPLYATSSWAINALTASYVENSQTSSFVTASNVYGPYGENSVLTASYSVTASWALDADLTGANAITRVSKSFELGGRLYRATSIDGASAGAIDNLVPFNTSSIGTLFNWYQLAVEDPITKKIYFAGYFTGYGSNPNVKNIVRLNPDYSLDTSFNVGNGITTGDGSFGDVRAVIVDKSISKVYIAGRFYSYSGSVVNHIARLNEDGTIDTTFQTNGGFSGGTLYAANFRGVYDMVMDSSGKLVVVGVFTSYSGSTGNNSIIRINQDGSKDTSFDNGTGLGGGLGQGYLASSVTLDQSNNVYVVGQFTNYRGAAANYIVGINSDGTRNSSFNVGNGFTTLTGNHSPYVISTADNKVLVGGPYTAYSGSSINKLVKINLNGTIDTSFVVSNFTTITSTAHGIPLASDHLNRYYIGIGSSSPWNYNGTQVYGMMRVFSNGQLDTSFQRWDGGPRSTPTGNPPVSESIFSAKGSVYVTSSNYYGLLAGYWNSTYAGKSAGNIIRFRTDPYEVIVSGSVLSYDSDYSYVLYNSRSLVDKQYVDNKFTGSFFSGSITGSLFGTSSWSNNSVTASFVATASWAVNSLTASSADSILVRQSVTASNVLVTGTITAQTLITQVVTSSTSFVTGSTIFGSLSTDTHQFTGSVIVSGSVISPQITGSLFGTSSWAKSSSLSLNSVTASYSLQAASSSYAATASSADTFVVRQEITASNALITGTITADTIIVQTFISSSGDTISGSTKFGSLLTDTHQFTGSVLITGSLTSPNMYGTASWAQNAITVQDQNFAIVYAIVL